MVLSLMTSIEAAVNGRQEERKQLEELNRFALPASVWEKKIKELFAAATRAEARACVIATESKGQTITASIYSLTVAQDLIQKAYKAEKAEKTKINNLFHSRFMAHPSIGLYQKTERWQQQQLRTERDEMRICQIIEELLIDLKTQEQKAHTEGLADAAKKALWQISRRLMPEQQQFSELFFAYLKNTRQELIEKKIYTVDEIAEAVDESYAAMLDTSLLRMIETAMVHNAELTLFYPTDGREYPLKPTLFNLSSYFATIHQHLQTLSSAQYHTLEQRLTHKELIAQNEMEAPVCSLFNLIEQIRLETIDRRIMNQHGIPEQNQVHFMDAFK